MTTHRTGLRFELVAEEPFSVAAPERAMRVDRPMSTDPWGSAYVPASSLAGSLRAHLTTWAAGQSGVDPSEFVQSLMGSESPLGAGPDEMDDAHLSPSRLRLLGTRLNSADGKRVTASDLENRSRTAVDQTRGSARSRTLHSVSLVPRGAKITLWALVDDVLVDDELQALGAWSPVVGGGRTTGHGRCRLAALHHGSVDLTEADGLRTWLKNGGPDLINAIATTELKLPKPEEAPVLADLTVEIVDGLLTARPEAEIEGVNDDGTGNGKPPYAAPLRDSNGDLVLPGTSIKGVLRSHVAYVLASLGAIDVEECSASDHACGICVVCDLFGSTDQRGRLAVRSAKIEGCGGRAPVVEKRPHVAIDRISGGARRGLLFSEKVVVSGQLRLVVESAGPVAPDQPWIQPLLSALAIDIHDGHVGFGSRTTRGFGTVKVVADGGEPFDEARQAEHRDRARTLAKALEEVPT